MLSTTKLSQHAVGQSEVREVRMLSQHATKTNHRLAKLDLLSQHTLQNLNCIKEAAKAQNTGQADTAK